MSEQNPLERRKDLLVDKLKARMGQVKAQIVEPKPYGMVRVSEENQVRQFMDIRDRGMLPALRERMGDDQVDSYVQQMSARAAKYMGALAERKINDSKKSEEATATEAGSPTATFYTADDDLESF